MKTTMMLAEQKRERVTDRLNGLLYGAPLGRNDIACTSHLAVTHDPACSVPVTSNSRRKTLEKHTYPSCACGIVRGSRGACAKQRDVYRTEQGSCEIHGRPRQRALVVHLLRHAALSAVWIGNDGGSRTALPLAFRARDRSDVVDRAPVWCDGHYARAARVQKR